jgi:hypothetical protein
MSRRSLLAASVLLPMEAKARMTMGALSSSGSGGSSTGMLPSGVTLQAIDGETMLSPTVMTNNYFARNGFTYATNTSFGAKSWDDPTYFLLVSYYGISMGQLSQFQDLGYTISVAVTGGTDPVTDLQANRIWGVPATPTTSTTEIPLAAATPGIHIDEADPTPFIANLPNANQDHRFIDLVLTATQYAFGTIGPYTMAQLLAPNIFPTPNGTLRSVDTFGGDCYFFAGSTDTTTINNATGVVWRTTTPPGNVAITPDLCARGSNYGNMMDDARGWGNGQYTNVGSGALGNGAPSRFPIVSYIENGTALISGTPRNPTPPEYNWAVWSSVIHGARIIITFADTDQSGGFQHSIQGGQTISTYDQGKLTHTLLNNLARILNSPFALGYATVTPHGYLFPTFEPSPANGGIELCCHWYQGGSFTNSSGTFPNGFYIFATTRNSETVTNTSATFTVKSGTTAVVVGESRSIPISAGSFTDTFANAWTVHIYQIQGGAAPYVGPGDVVSGAVGWWGLRAYSAAKAGTKAVRLRRDSDNSESDFNTLASGKLDIASITAFQGAANLFVTTLYDQAGTNNAIMTTVSQQPQLIMTGSFPVMNDSNGAHWLTATNTVTQAQPFTRSWYARRTTDFTVLGNEIGASVTSEACGFYNSSNTAWLKANTLNNSAPGATDSVFNAVQCVMNGAAGDINVNGTVNTTNTGTDTFSADTLYLAGGGFLNLYVKGDSVEFGYWGIAFTSTQSANMSANQHAFWV